MSKRLMLAVTVATMAALALPATSQAGGLRSDAGARKGCFLTHMMTRANKHLFRPVLVGGLTPSGGSSTAITSEADHQRLSWSHLKEE